jgi:FkbM family methyltransferase
MSNDESLDFNKISDCFETWNLFQTTCFIDPYPNDANAGNITTNPLKIKDDLIFDISYETEKNRLELKIKNLTLQNKIVSESGEKVATETTAPKTITETIKIATEDKTTENTTNNTNNNNDIIPIINNNNNTNTNNNNNNQKNIIESKVHSHSVHLSLLLQKLEQQLIHTKEMTILGKRDLLPMYHCRYLYYLKHVCHFEPKVIYDIGACVLHWTKIAQRVWPNATIILFDGFESASFLWPPRLHHLGLLSDEKKTVKFWQNKSHPGGNSYYREIGSPNADYYFPENECITLETDSLDNVVNAKQFPLPDLVKIDVQGAEIDILKGGLKTMLKTQRMIVELQSMQYNRGAPTVTESLPWIQSQGWTCCDPLFTNAGPDGDYGFVKK